MTSIPSHAAPAEASRPRRFGGGQDQVEDQDHQRNRTGNIQPVRHLPGDERLVPLDNFLADGNDYSGVEGEAALPEHERGDHEEAPGQHQERPTAHVADATPPRKKPLSAGAA